ncbi:TetR/AcrR family transcriptional regulator [Ramlibacter sp. PS3R-8]|uniref:TetR/AcrR family transcriptional regulator n=1 Tax=Ramlibacter sp. PS3R-8 TaxID=3133437 RepID=UPI00309B5CAA
MSTRRTDRSKTARKEASPAGQAREAILAAARQEFSAKGPAGARVNEIAARSGVNKQLIYYYFGNKEGLYAAALEAVYGEIRELEQGLLLDEEPPDVAMRALVAFSFDYLAAHPEFIGMLKHENASGAHQIQQSETLQGLNSPLIASIRKTLKRGVAAGAFREGVDPLNLYISIAGMSYFFFSNRLTLSSIFGRNLAHARSVSAYRRHVLDYAMAGLKPD